MQVCTRRPLVTEDQVVLHLAFCTDWLRRFGWGHYPRSLSRVRAKAGSDRMMVSLGTVSDRRM